MSRQEFEKLVRAGIRELPKAIRVKMDNVGIVIEDEATPAQRQSGGMGGNSGLLLGLYQGVPQTRRGPFYTLVLPDKITIFQKAIEAVATTPEAIKKQVRETVWHEVAHHFGFNDPQIYDLKIKRQKKKQSHD